MNLKRIFSASNNQNSQNSSGFTIIEVLIVLAIGGLIFLIVFEALPSIARASRNGQRKQDINVILDAVSHYELKDSDNFPINCGAPGPIPAAQPFCNTSAGASSPNDYFMQYSLNSLTYYKYSTPTSNPIMLEADWYSTYGKDPDPVTDPNVVQVYDYEKCAPGGKGLATHVSADFSDIVALYALENGSGPGTPMCQEL